MIKLDYRTQNFAHGLSGIVFSSWKNYAFSLGYLANAAHYRDIHHSALISLRYEPNDTSGAIEKEGRIQYYGDSNFLMRFFPDWYACRSAGKGNMTWRINSNDYVFFSLVSDYSFTTYIAPGEKTVRVFPPNDTNSILKILLNNLPAAENKQTVIDAFKDGFNL